MLQIRNRKFVLRTTSAALAGGLVLFEFLRHVLNAWLSVEVIIGTIIFLLPTFILASWVKLGPWVENTCLLLPASLGAGFWVANSFGDALGYGLFMGLYVAPFAIAYAMLLVFSHWRTRISK